jgi:hypothetical protein
MPDGRRAWGTITDEPATLQAMTVEEVVGRSVTLGADGGASFA